MCLKGGYVPKGSMYVQKRNIYVKEGDIVKNVIYMPKKGIGYTAPPPELEVGYPPPCLTVGQRKLPLHLGG
jgi:hypothetical protein